MPSQRSADQTVVTASMPRELVMAMDRACADEGLTRSLLIRMAIQSLLSGTANEIPARLAEVPPVIVRRADASRKTSYRKGLRRKP